MDNPQQTTPEGQSLSGRLPLAFFTLVIMMLFFLLPTQITI
ncbi:MAG TPA: hypothetical protein VIM51_04225 [Desulfosporosinus sp.]